MRLALGDGTDLGADAAFGEDGGLGIECRLLDHVAASGVETDFGSPVDEAEAS